MKMFFLTCIMISGIATVNAQSNGTAEASASGQPSAMPASAPSANPDADKRIVYMTRENQWSLIDMKVSGKAAYFYNINDLNALRVYVTNGDGMDEFDSKISPKHNGVDISRLPKGLHYVTLVNENTDEKRIFMLNL